MIRGIYTSASALLGEEQRLDVVSNNLANVNTPGFKRDTPVYHSFAQLLIQRVNDGAGGVGTVAGGAAARLGRLGTGSYLDHVYVDYRPGAPKRTDNPRDLMLDGRGFFAVSTPQGTRYTRSLSLTDTLTTAEGYAVMGVDGPLPTDRQNYAVTPDGQVTADGQPVGRLLVVDFPDLQGLSKVGDLLYRSTTAAGPAEQVETTVKSGFLESPNVSPVTEMVEMISVMRAYEANQRALQIQDGTLGSLISEVSR